MHKKMLLLFTECQALRCAGGCNREQGSCHLCPRGAPSLVRERMNQLKGSFLKDFMEKTWCTWTQRVIILTLETCLFSVQLERDNVCIKKIWRVRRTRFCFVLFCFIFDGCTHSIWKFLGQELNLSSSCKLHWSCGNTRDPLTHRGRLGIEATAVRDPRHCSQIFFFFF